MSDCSEKLVAQAFQPGRITEAGETPALRLFIIFRGPQAHEELPSENLY